MASIREVAKEAGVSIATVSRVINGVDSVAPKLRRNVMKAVKACDYMPGVGRRSLDGIALIYVGPFSIGGPYDSACLQGMVEAMRETRFDLSIVDLHRDKRSAETLQQFFTRKGICGAILRCTIEQRSLVSELAEENLPLVILGDHFECAGLSCVYADSLAASREAVEHLVTLGHKRIAFAACERDDGDHLDRLRAYRTVLEQHNLLDESLVCRVPLHRLDGAQLLRNLLGTMKRPTALFVADPLVAVEAINEAHKLGVKLPNDLSIVGFDDSDVRNLVHPRMSTVCQDARVLGRLAFEEVVRMVDEGQDAAPQPTSHSAWLEIGNTSGPPPQNPERILPTGGRLPI